MAFTPDPNLIAEHRHWLSQFHPQHRLNWEREFRKDSEAMAGEAAVRRLLEHSGVQVIPAEDLTGGRKMPDFRCEKNGNTFFVEATHVAIETATRITDLSNKLSE